MLSGNTLSQLVPFVVAPILARLFSPIEFAVVANFMAIVGVFGIVATGRLELAVPLPKDKKSAQEIVFTGLVITLIITTLSISIPLLSKQLADWYNDDLLSNYLWLVPMAVMSYGLLGLATNWNLREQRFGSVSIGKIVQSLVNNLLAAALGYYGWGANGLIIAWVISQYINIFVLVTSVERKIPKSNFSLLTIKSTLRDYKDFPMINSLHAFTDILVTQFLLFWIISGYFGLVELGLFAMMHKYVRAPIVLISSSVSQLFYVEAGRCLNHGESVLPILKKTVRTSVFFAIPFILVVTFFGQELFKWYLGAEWEKAGLYAQLIVPTMFFYFIISPISSIPILMNQQKQAFMFSVIGYSLVIASMMIAVWLQLPFEKALWAYTISFSMYYLLLLAWYYSLLKKVKNESLD